MSDEEILSLFHGMSESMQKAVIQIMEVTQENKTAYSDFRHRIVAAAFEIENDLKGEKDA